MNKNIIRFLLVGGISTALDYIVYLILLNFVHIVIAKFISMFCAITISYFLNKIWTFEYNNNTNTVLLLKFIFTQAINISINVLCNYLIFISCHNKHVAFIIATIVATIFNFLLQKYFVFIKRR